MCVCVLFCFCFQLLAEKEGQWGGHLACLFFAPFFSPLISNFHLHLYSTELGSWTGTSFSTRNNSNSNNHRKATPNCSRHYCHSISSNNQWKARWKAAGSGMKP